MEEQSSYSSVIKNTGFINLWINQVLVQLTYNSLNFALILWVFHLTGSTTANSALLLSVYLPAVLFGIFAGTFVDITDRKRIFIFIDFLMFLCLVVLIFIKNIYPAILIDTFIINTLAQFYIPAESASIPLLVKKNQLLQANSLFSITLFVTLLVGFGLAGPIITRLGIDFVFILGSTLLFMAFLLATRFPSIKVTPDQASEKLLEALKFKRLGLLRELFIFEVKQTLISIRGNFSVTFSILILSGVQAIVGILGVLVPSFLEKVLQISANDASYILIVPLGVGTILGALLIGKIGSKIPRRTLVGKAIVVVGLMFLAIGIAPLISPAIKYFSSPHPLPFFHQPSLSTIFTIGSFIAGMALASIIIPSQTVLQENTKEQERGKIFSVLAMVMSAFSIIPVLFSGILADLFGTMPIFIGMGGGVAIIGLFALKPDFFFHEWHLSYKLREFLGLGHWRK